ncbi:uncharacterized protein LOC120342487 [Styela clava]|uniref:uncharacterized protein LOC120342487 n=1 Tax=Styela clava TaxID=7725 RepID=UPI0019396835|nr:uncharacterized protein LOC120342487 [Styela clava]
MKTIIFCVFVIFVVFVETVYTRSIAKRSHKTPHIDGMNEKHEERPMFLSRRRRHADGTMTDRLGKLLGRQGAKDVVNLVKGKDASSNSPLTKCISRRLRNRKKVTNRFYKRVMMSCVRHVFK